VREFEYVQPNGISRGFLELESRSFWLDTIPEAFASAKSNGNSRHRNPLTGVDAVNADKRRSTVAINASQRGSTYRVNGLQRESTI